MIYPFGEYLPDLPALENPGAKEAKNVLPSGVSYRQVQGLSPLSNGVPGGNSYTYTSTASSTLLATASFRPQGAYSTRLPSTGDAINFTGDAVGLYKLDNGAAVWSDVRKAMANYTTGATERWEFAQFSDLVIATNFSDTMQHYTLGSAGVFSDLSALTAMPKARYIDTVRDFLVVGNLYNVADSTNYPQRLQWSGIGAPAVWGVDPVTQTDYQDLNGDHGWIYGIVGGEYGVIFQELAITRMDYVGSPIVFQFRTVETNQGTRFPGSIVPVGSLIFYMGIDGFYVFDGNNSTAIGVNKVDRTFFGRIDQSYPERIYGSVDYENHLIVWSVPVAGNIGGRPNQLIYYNYSPNAKNRWSYSEQEVELIYTTVNGSYNLDTIDNYLAAIGSVAAALGIDYPPLPSFDSNFWKQSTRDLGAFAIPIPDESITSRLATFSGSPLTAVLQTSEQQITPKQRTDLYLIQPYVIGTPAIMSGSSTSVAETNITMEVGERDLLTKSISFGASIALDDIGQVPVTSNARYHTLQVTIENGFADAMGVEVLEASPGGYR